MRISINLATRPFVELRPLFARLRLVMAGLAILAIALGIGLYVMAGRAKVDKAEMDSLKAQTAALEKERQTNEARMMQPQNRAVLERSKFLNSLFARKSFSWTAVMMDLERVLPPGVQVTSIEPTVSAEGNVSIRLRVSGDRERAVDLVRNLERSERFVAPRLANESAQAQEQGRVVNAAQVGVPGGVEFEILSGYNPLPPAVKGKTEQPVEKTSVTKPVSSTVAHPKAGAGHATAGGAVSGKKNGAPVPMAARKPSANGGAR